MNGNKVLKTLVSLVVSAFFIWLTLRDKDLNAVWVSIQTANYLWLLPYLGILTCIHFLRTLRWGILLEPVGKPTFARLNSSSAIGFMALVLLPFRLGEFARPLLIADARIRRSAAMASVVIERVVDGLAMALVLMIALLFSKPATDNATVLFWARMSGVGVFGIFFGILCFLVLAYKQRELAVRIVNACARPVSPRLAAKLAGMLDSFIGGLKMVPDRRKVVLFFAMTVGYWGLNALGMSILARGFGFELGVVPSLAVLGILVAGVMIPAGPGMVGPFQKAVEVGMALFFPGTTAQGPIVAYSWVLWAAQIGQQTLFGLYFMVLGHVSFRRLVGGDEEAEPAAGAEGQGAAGLEPEGN